MASDNVQTTPPATADHKDAILGRYHPLSMSPSPWAEAPPTPQDSLISPCQTPLTSPSLHLAEPASPSPTRPDEDDNILMHDTGSAAKTASLRRSTPTLITIGPKVNRANRMQQWLSDIPLPVSPQERYIQGLNPAVDHPLHPRPLCVSAPRQARYLSSINGFGGDDNLSTEYEKLAIDVLDKENAMIRTRANNLENLAVSPNGPAGEAGLGTKKRQLAEDTIEAGLARKRTRLLDPVRRFSQRLSSSLALASGSEEEKRDSEDLSPEDIAKQSQMLYKFGGLSKTPSNSIRSSFSRRHTGTVRSQGSAAISRIMSSKLVPPMTSLSRDSQIGYWSDGAPDMIVNVAFIGDARVGKTALIKRLVYGTFPQTYAPSEIQEQTIRLIVDGARVQLNLSEGGSGRDPREPSVLALGWFSVVVLCFDIGHATTLESLYKYRNDIAMYEENSVVVLAGLKKDARRRLPPLQLTFVEDAVQVGPDKAQETARSLRCASYFECSSLSSCEGVDDLFDYIVHSGVELQKNRIKTMSRFRFERTIDKGMTRIAEGVRSLFTFHGSGV